METRHGGYLIMGRSDAVLNPGGVRIGTAEIYRQVEQLDAVLEAVAVGQAWEGDVRVVLFVVLREGLALTDALTDEIKTRIRTGTTPRHVPQVVLEVADIPRTRSGKITELAVRERHPWAGSEQRRGGWRTRKHWSAFGIWTRLIRTCLNRDNRTGSVSTFQAPL